MALANGCILRYQYDPLGQVISGRRYWAAGTPVAGQQFEYGFDDIGNRKTTGGRASAESTYTVNDLEQYDSRIVAGAVEVLGIANPTADPTQPIPQLGGRGSCRALTSGPQDRPPRVRKENQGSAGASPSRHTVAHDADDKVTRDGRWTCVWGNDLSGWMQGAGGVGGLHTKLMQRLTEHHIPTRAFIGMFATLLVAALVGNPVECHAKDGEEKAYEWEQVLQIKLDPKTTDDIWEPIDRRVMARARNESAFLQKIRHTLRWSTNADYRYYAAAIILRVEPTSLQDDVLFMLGDADEWLFSVAFTKMRLLHRQGKWRIPPTGDVMGDEHFAVLLGLPLSGHSTAASRWVALSAIWDAVGADGLPFYARLLSDPDVDVAIEAATLLSKCPKENAGPLLIRSLARQRGEKNRTGVCNAILDVLDRMYGHSGENKGQGDGRARFWVNKLDNDAESAVRNPEEMK